MLLSQSLALKQDDGNIKIWLKVLNDYNIVDLDHD